MTAPEFGFAAKDAIEWAQEEARNGSSPSMLLPEHILIGIVRENGGIAGRVLRGAGITPEGIRHQMEVMLDGTNKQTDPHTMSTGAHAVVEKAAVLAAKEQASVVGSQHLFYALFEVSGNNCRRILEALGVDANELVQAVRAVAPEIEPEVRRQSPGPSRDRQAPAKRAIGGALRSFGEDITQRAIDGKLDPVIGRESEIETILEILHMRTKPNPLIIGPAGSGKTALVEGVAQRLLQSSDENMRAKHIIAISLTNLLAGSSLRGSLEDKVKAIIEEASADKNVILFFDEVHTLVDTGGLGFGNQAKAALARGEIRCIGATTINEGRRMMKDAALVRRFRTVNIDPPNREQTLEILRGLAGTYEKYHDLSIPETVLRQAVDWSGRYNTSRVWPDSAIDLMDDGAVVRKLALSKDARQRKKNPDIYLPERSRVVSAEDLATALAAQTGIPMEEILNTATNELLGVDAKLSERVIGQPEAVNVVSRALRRSRAGLREPNRPVGSFLFLGPTGVGKTQLARSLAKYLFGEEDSMIRIDMSEFSEPHSISNLIGAPPGYVGYEEGGVLTEAIKRRPYSVVLFDEIEKAHPNAYKILLQLLDTGKLTEASGRKIDASNIIFVATSNIGGGPNASKSIGFSTSDQERASDADRYRRAAEGYFPPELINRFDALVPFHHLTVDHCVMIADIFVKEQQDRCRKEYGVELQINPRGLRQLVEQSTNTETGARELRRAITTNIVDPLSDFLLRNHLEPGSEIEMDPTSPTSIRVNASAMQLDMIA